MEELTGITSEVTKSTTEKPPLTKAEEVDLKFEKERKDWTAKVIALAESQRSTAKLADVLVDCHSNRQRLIDNISDLNRTISKISNKITKQRAEHLKKLTDTSKMDNSAFRYSDKDREKLIEAELIEPKNNLSIITNHLDFLKETTKTVDNMIWNLRYIISLHENNFR